MQLPKSKAVSFTDKISFSKNPMILESIEESPGSRPQIKIEDGKDLNFETMMVCQMSPTNLRNVQESGPDIMEIDDEEDGLPKTQEAEDIIVK